MFMRLCDPNRVGVYYRILYVYETLWSKQGWGLLLNPLHPVCLWDFCGLNRVGAYYWIPYILYVYETFVVKTGLGPTIESLTSCMFMRLLWSKQGWGLLLNPLHPVCLWDFCGPNRVGVYYWIPYILYVYETFVVKTGLGPTIESLTSCMFMRLLWSKQGWGLLLNPLHPVGLWDFYNSLLLHLIYLFILTDPVHGILLDIVIYWYYINLQKSVALIFTVYEIF